MIRLAVDDGVHGEEEQTVWRLSWTETRVVPQSCAHAVAPVDGIDIPIIAISIGRSHILSIKRAISLVLPLSYLQLLIGIDEHPRHSFIITCKLLHRSGAHASHSRERAIGFNRSTYLTKSGVSCSMLVTPKNCIPVTISSRKTTRRRICISDLIAW